MRLAIIGAAGRTGGCVIAAATARGHEVIAIARRPPPGAPTGPTWRVADVLDRASLRAALAGCDAVILTIGPQARDDARTCGEGTANVVAVARELGLGRLAAVTGAMIGHDPARLAWLLRRIRASFRRRQPTQAADRDAQEAAIRASGLAWTLVRPTRLVDGPPTQARLGVDLHVGALAVSRRSDVAAALVAGVEAERGLGGVAIVSTP